MLRDFAAFLKPWMRFTVAIAVAVLPGRYWPRLDERLPVSRAALVSAIATLALAGVMALPAFLDEAQASADRAAEAMLQSTGWRLPAPGARVPSIGGAVATWLTSYLSFLSFAFLTPVGLLSTYLGISAVFRAVCVVVGEPRGDPLLTVIDASVRRAWFGRRTRQARVVRERLEGPEVPDRLIPASAAGFPEADFVVVASRRKPGWNAGVFVITSEKWYRLGTPVERQMPGGLRTLYPLSDLSGGEVLRRGIAYEMPALSGSFSRPE